MPLLRASPVMAWVLVSLLLFSLSSISSSLSLSSQTLQNASETLSTSGFVSMALILESAPQTLLSTSAAAATVFSPSDVAFSESGQPPLSLLRYHLSHQRFPPETLRSLPFGSKIRTLTPDLSLTVTTSATDGQISINGVKINESAVYDDGSLIVYGADQFFDPFFEISTLAGRTISSPSSTTFQCNARVSTGSFTGAPDKLRSMGYSVMASFLDLQLGWDLGEATLFAPADRALGGCAGNFSEYVSVFRRHIVPCRITGGNLADLAPGSILPTFLEGFTISVERSNGRTLLNGVPVSDVDMYDGSLLVHGIDDVLKPLDTALEFGEHSDIISAH